jgi:hypothetical protein
MIHIYTPTSIQCLNDTHVLLARVRFGVGGWGTPPPLSPSKFERNYYLTGPKLDQSKRIIPFAVEKAMKFASTVLAVLAASGSVGHARLSSAVSIFYCRIANMHLSVLSSSQPTCIVNRHVLGRRKVRVGPPFHQGAVDVNVDAGVHHCAL